MSILRERFGWCVLVAGIVAASTAVAAETELEQAFRSPPPAARPWVYWWWLNSNVTRDGITRDLEEMHRQGIQGVLQGTGPRKGGRDGQGHGSEYLAERGAEKGGKRKFEERVSDDLDK
jgi:hypothetical protein